MIIDLDQGFVEEFLTVEFRFCGIGKGQIGNSFESVCKLASEDRTILISVLGKRLLVYIVPRLVDYWSSAG